MNTPTALQLARLTEAQLAAASIDSLLTAAYSLTHRMHAARVSSDCDCRDCTDQQNVERERELRWQRDMISDEIKRRCESVQS